MVAVIIFHFWYHFYREVVASAFNFENSGAIREVQRNFFESILDPFISLRYPATVRSNEVGIYSRKYKFFCVKDVLKFQLASSVEQYIYIYICICIYIYKAMISITMGDYLLCNMKPFIHVTLHLTFVDYDMDSVAM